MDFHHRDPKTKKFTIGRGGYRHSKKDVLEEIKKCDLYCGNCHRIIEYEKRNGAGQVNSLENSIPVILEKCPRCNTENGVCYHCRGHSVMCISCDFSIFDDTGNRIEFKTIEEAHQIWNIVAKSIKN